MHSALKLLVIIALLTMLAFSPLKAQLVKMLPSSDADAIELSSRGGRGSGPVQVCLVTARGMRRKEIRLANSRVLRSRNGANDCTTVPSTGIRYSLAKQKNGLVLEIGAGILDLSGYGGGRVKIFWRKD